MNSYLQGQDLWDVVGGNEVNPPNDVTALKKMEYQGKYVMFAIKTVLKMKCWSTSILWRCQRKHGTHSHNFPLKKVRIKRTTLVNSGVSIKFIDKGLYSFVKIIYK